MENNKLNEWVKIDALLQAKLKELDELNKERDLLISKAEKQKELTPKMKKAMEMSLTKLTKLANEVYELKQQAKAIKGNK